jgi:asparagine synthase (glutamine-hydrolysing)
LSGIVGVINTDGAPVDRRLLARMTEFMAFRGPDGRKVWADGHAGFGHAMLRTTRESEGETQPFSLDGRVWITADARIDGRDELIRKLRGERAEGEIDAETAPDVELIWRSYHVWGEGCVEHLLGDFSFAIWDGQRKRLFCARDHFGVKPFFYARVGSALVFGNTLDCVRLHPDVLDDLDDTSIADFLLFGYCQEPDRTAFADIRRLPAAHLLIYSNGGLVLKRYWTIPTGGRTRYKRAGEYVEHFRGLMQKAVGDRMRAGRVAVSMSGGLDSTSVAAVARKLPPGRDGRTELRAFTIVYDKLLSDPERYYAGVAARGIGIPVDYLAADDYQLFERWGRDELRRPEPTDFPFSAFVADHLRRVASHGRVLLSGEGGDALLSSSYPYFVNQLKRLRLGRILRFMIHHYSSYGRLPRLGFRTVLKNLSGAKQKNGWEDYYVYPEWLDDGLIRRLDLPRRFEQMIKEPPPVHPTRPEAYKFLQSHYWSVIFERADPGVTSIPVETRYPFFDLRLVYYLLSIPSLPWFAHKEILRSAMRGLLPEEIRGRRKTPLGGDAALTLLTQPESGWVDEFNPVPALLKYVKREAIPPLLGEKRANHLWLNIRPLSLNYWLQDLKAVKAEEGETLCNLRVRN